MFCTKLHRGPDEFEPSAALAPGTFITKVLCFTTEAGRGVRAAKGRPSYLSMTDGLIGVLRLRNLPLSRFFAVNDDIRGFQ